MLADLAFTAGLLVAAGCGGARTNAAQGGDPPQASGAGQARRVTSTVTVMSPPAGPW
jgi:hypothetical protein